MSRTADPDRVVAIGHESVPTVGRHSFPHAKHRYFALCQPAHARPTPVPGSAVLCDIQAMCRSTRLARRRVESPRVGNHQTGCGAYIQAAQAIGCQSEMTRMFDALPEADFLEPGALP